MPVADRIHENVQKLPESLQTEVLDFVEFLLHKSERQGDQTTEDDWTNLSLTMAMRGMEDEQGPTYKDEDLKVVFS